MTFQKRHLAALMGALSLSVLGTASAHATTTGAPALAGSGSCSGSLVESQQFVTSGGTVAGYLNLYWNGSRNCATVTSSSVDWGVNKLMGVGIIECATDSPSSCDNPIASQHDPVNDWWASYRYYAGPVSVPGSGHCVQASGMIQWDGEPLTAQTQQNHC